MTVSSFIHPGLPGRVRFGVGTVGRVADEVAALGGTRALLIATASMTATARRLADQLGDRLVAVVDRVVQHVPEELAVAVRRRAVEAGADVVVSLGGGSATGLAKAVAVAIGAPIVAVPTTYAGSEVTPVYGITGAHKVTRSDPRAVPRVVVYDPELTRSLPRRTTATSGLNALAHCVSAVQRPDANPVGELFAEAGVRRLAGALPRCAEAPDDLDARGEALFGAYLAGAAFAIAGAGLHHRLCHVLGGDYGLVHAEVHAALLPYTVDGGRGGRIATLLGAESAPTALYDLAVRLGAPTSLAAIGLPVEALDVAATRCAVEPVDRPAIRALLDAAFHGRRPSPH
ncbi:MAG TPA: maleylacetate reductase [Micromonosporaceae bacterium]|jgi:maleylacetate reductase|nr:maleylacetate reductase [Micromonosporaceae bacterium]